MLSEISPATSEAVPLLGIFFSSCMIIVTASTVFTVYVLNLHYRGPETHEMTPLARTILLYWLPYFLRIERPGIYLSWEALPSLMPFSKPKRHSESLIRKCAFNIILKNLNVSVSNRPRMAPGLFTAILTLDGSSKLRP